MTSDVPHQNLEGQTLGTKGRMTRQRLLGSVEALLQDRVIHEISVSEVAQQAGTSSATFYLYFRDVSHAALHVVNSHTQSTPRLLQMIQEPWVGNASIEADAFVREYIASWTRQGRIFRVRNLAAEAGHAEFTHARELAVRPLLEALSARIEALQSFSPMPDSFPAVSMSAVLIALLEILAAVSSAFADNGEFATSEGIIAATAHLMASVLADRSA